MDEHEPTDATGLLRHYLSDLIYGANDGIITTFAVVTGVTGAALESKIVVILGLANLVAGFEMLFVGALAAYVAYFIGDFLAGMMR